MFSKIDWDVELLVHCLVLVGDLFPVETFDRRILKAKLEYFDSWICFKYVNSSILLSDGT
jgi:hypothetical protein